MAANYKVLGQITPAATTLTILYTVPSGTQAVCSTLVVCNTGLSTTFRIAVRPAGAAIDPKHYQIYDSYVNANDSVFLTLGITIGATDVVSVYAGTTTVSFSLFGSELV